MEAACLDYCLTEKERLEFDQNGFLVVEDALPPEIVEEISPVVDRLDAQYRAREGSDPDVFQGKPTGTIDPNRPPDGLLGPHDRLNLLDFVGKDEIFLELLDWPKTFPKVWGILGWNIQIYHSHMAVTPPLLSSEEAVKKRLGWHQDSGRLNIELEATPRPRISLKVGFFLTDTTEAGRGNFYVIPGSHLQNEVEFPADGVSDPEGGMPVRVPPGTAVFFDRRLWHAASPNHSDITRKVLFYGYSYRWLRPRDDITVSHFMDRCDPIRRQLLGDSPTGWHGYTSPREEDVPLRTWLKDHLGEEAVVP
jgi:hypothetical protein